MYPGSRPPHLQTGKLRRHHGQNYKHLSFPIQPPKYPPPISVPYFLGSSENPGRLDGQIFLLFQLMEAQREGLTSPEAKLK